MGLNRIVNLFHAKLNNVSDNISIISGGNGDSGSERNDDFDSSANMSWASSSAESLAASSLSVQSATAAAVDSVTDLGLGLGPPTLDSAVVDVNNNSVNCNGNLQHVWNPSKRFQFGSNEAKVRLPSNTMVEGGANLQNPTAAGPPKRGSALSRRFSLKAKFSSSDMDLYGTTSVSHNHRRISVDADVGGPVATTSTTEQSSSASLGRNHLKKSIWASFRLPVRLMKGNELADGRRGHPPPPTSPPAYMWFNVGCCL